MIVEDVFDLIHLKIEKARVTLESLLENSKIDSVSHSGLFNIMFPFG